MPTDDELYDQVVTRGHRLRRRRQAVLGSGAAVALVVVALAAFGLAGDDGGDREAVVADVSESTTTATTEPEGTTSTSTTLVPATSSTATTVAAPTTTESPVATDDEPEAPTTTEAPVVCRNSREPVCGPFYWDPVPPNLPVTFNVTVDPPQPVAGQPVTMTVEAHDPEAAVLFMGSGDLGPCRPDWGDGTLAFPGCIRTMEQRLERPPRTGPWDPPAPVGASTTGTFVHTYAQPGTYTITVRAQPITSLDVKNSDYDVYGSTAADVATVTITVG